MDEPRSTSSDGAIVTVPGEAGLESAQRWIALPDGARLALFREGAALLPPGAPDGPIWLSSGAHVRLTGGPWLRRLELGERTYSVTARLGRQCVELLGLARLQAPSGVARPALVAEHSSALEAAGIASVLQPDELLLCCFRSRIPLEGASPALGAFRRAAWWVLSDRRCLLVAVSPAGDVVVEEPGAPRSLDGRVLVTPGRRLVLPQAFVPYQDCVLLEPADRALEVGRRVFLADAATRPEVERVLATLAHRGDPRAAWLGWFLALANDGTAPLPAGLQSPLDVEPFVLWEQWRLPEGALERVFARLPRGEPFDAIVERWAERVWLRERVNVELDALASSVRDADLRFAERLLGRGQRRRAKQVLDDSRHSLPRPAANQVLLPGLPRSPETERRARLETLRLEAADDAEARLAARRALVALAPLTVEHLAVVAELDDALGERARDVLGCLVEPVPADPSDRPRKLGPLPADVIERRLRRDLGQVEPGLGLRLQTWIAHEARPDPEVLKHYCERITRAEHPVLRIVAESSTVLGLGHVDVYVSRGDEDVGLRVFPGTRPFLLIGGRHLEPGSTHALAPDELRFAIAAELLHLRAGNVRVGSRDVWRGALRKGRTGLDIALGVLPLLQGIKLLDRLGVATAKLSLPQVGKVLDMTRKVRGAVADDAARTESHGLSSAAEKLLSTQRELQLWADRIGLLCVGSFGAPLRAMAITRHDTVRIARDLQGAGFLTVLEQHRASEPEVFDYLLLRVAHLAAFYLSEDYATLRAALTRASDPE